MAESIAVVGAGVGGLALAARLGFKGYQVNVYEKLAQCGGRANLIEDCGFKFDTGPSFVMMPSFFKELFVYCGKDINEYIQLKVLDVHYKIFYPDGDSFTVYLNEERTKTELERIEPGGYNAYKRFIAETAKIYQAVEPLLYQCFTPSSLFNPKYFRLVPKLKLGSSYWQLAKRFFKTDKLCYAFTFEAMFIGVSPFKTPGFYSVITYTDHVDKIAHALGGMYTIPKGLEQLAKEFGVKFHYNTEIDSIDCSSGKPKLKQGKNTIEADRVVVNADYSYAQHKLLAKKPKNYLYSCSVLLFYWGMKQKIPNLEHHNLFFAEDLNKNLSNIFETGEITDDFSFYIHLPTVTDPSLAPKGKDIIYLLVPVPNLKISANKIEDYESKIKARVIAKIKQVSGLDITNLIEVEHKFYPKDFITRYNIDYGATFGLAHNFMQSAFFRPANFDQKCKKVYFVGASVQPGGGLPPVIASSKITADLIEQSS